MTISYNWLKQYLNVDLNPETLSEILTSIGLEVESLHKLEPIKGGLNGFVIGEVIECAKHPDADKLSVTKVNAGTGELLDIVCGAPNVAAGQKVIIATVGTTIYKDNDSFVIKKSKIRGAVSEGMICAEDEIGIGTSHEGIMVLNSDAVIGMPVKNYFKIEDDFIFEIGLTPNRIDAACHIGVAADLAAYLKQTMDVNLIKPSVEAFKVENNDLIIDIDIQNAEGCLRYSGVTIKNVTVAESPDWLKSKILAIGLKPINNIVDISNYVLFETNQPLHTFDADMIKDNKVVVKTLPHNTKFTTLDHIERNIIDTDLMICNAHEPMCIAGVMGGLDSGITNNTKHIFIESACFNPIFVRRTSKRLGISSDSSFRFERGTDINNAIYALKRAALLIKEIAGGTISSNIVDFYPNPINHFEVSISFKNVDRLLGINIERDKLKNILLSLNFNILSETESGYTLAIPTNKVDVLREADVIEEVLRIYGYNNIPISNHINSSVSYYAKPDKEKINNMVSDILTNNGFNEIMCNSLTSSNYNNKYLQNENKSTVYILNPLSAELDSMRSSLIFGGLESILYNVNRKGNNLKFYEFGYSYTNKHNAESTIISDKFDEQLHLSLFLSGIKSEENWNTKPEAVSFYTMKSYIENILVRLGINIANIKINDTNNIVFDYGLNYMINNSILVEFGEINNNILKGFDIKQTVFYADFNWDLVLKQLKNSKTEYKEISKFPEVRRDLALLITKDIKFEQLRDVAFKNAGKLLKKVSIFDVYTDAKIGDDKKSYALSYILQDNDKTLTDKQIEIIMERIIEAYKKQFGAAIR